MYYHGARYYVPWLGRWGSADSIGLGDGPNRYIYCRNRPSVSMDPSGMGAVIPWLLFIPSDSPPSEEKVIQSNRAFVQGLAADVATGKTTSLEALAVMFESPSIADDGTATSRLASLRGVFARQDPAGLFLGLPGAGADPQTNAPTLQFDASGFARQFQDTESQAKHFLFAVQATADPAEYVGGLPGLLPTSATDALTKRFTVGHEQAPGNVQGALAVISRIALALWRPSAEDIKAFEAGDFSKIKQFAGEEPIGVPDLALSVAGIQLGEFIRSGEIQTGAEAAAWIRTNLGDAGEK